MVIKTGYSSEEYKRVYPNYAPVDDCIIRDICDGYVDYINVYPFFMEKDNACYYWGSSVVSATMVTNPLSGLTIGYPYKEHYIVDLPSYDFKDLPENHRRNIKRYIKEDSEVTLVSRIVTNKHDGIEDYIHNYYQNLVKRHNISGVTDYSKGQIRQLIDVPGAVLFETLYYKSIFHIPYTINYSLFYIDGDDVYYHLSAQNDEGYKLASNFVMMHTAITFFKSLGLNKLLLGAVADTSAGNGLQRFKKGFSTESRWNHIVKYVVNNEKYVELSEGKTGDYFPLYRS